MNKVVLSITALFLITASAACQVRQDPSPISYEDLEAYNAWVETQKNKTLYDGFKAKDLDVFAVGKVKAIPDIAVITARVSAKNINESKALNSVAKQVNAVQTSLKGRDIETGFTDIRSTVIRDPKCITANSLARQRHNQINSDYRFNKTLDNRGDKVTQRRDPKPRLAQAVCSVDSVKVITNMVIRVKPAKDAGLILKALGDASISSAQLYGYDFSNYDALYQDAAEEAVFSARKKAEMIARVAKTDLGEITRFSVQGPSRIGRFGPQPTLVNKNKNLNLTPHYQTYSDSVMVQEASTELVSVPATYETVRGADGVNRRVVKRPASVQERTIPSVNKMVTRRVPIMPAPTMNTQTNTGTQNTALQMSLLSGPQTISVTAQLSYTYATPIDGTIVPDKD